MIFTLKKIKWHENWNYCFFFAAYGIARRVNRFPAKPMTPFTKHQKLAIVPKVELGKQFSISIPLDHASRHLWLIELVVLRSQDIFKATDINPSFSYLRPTYVSLILLVDVCRGIISFVIRVPVITYTYRQILI